LLPAPAKRASLLIENRNCPATSSIKIITNVFMSNRVMADAITAMPYYLPKMGLSQRAVSIRCA